jgi:hypothetical protein
MHWQASARMSRALTGREGVREFLLADFAKVGAPAR